MLFPTYLFAFFFLPVCLVCYYLLRFLGRPRLAILSLIGFSLFFYAWWNPGYLWILIGSILANYLLSRALIAARGSRPALTTGILVAGVIGNLAVLAHYKYWCLLGGDGACQNVVLPLAISFFTFQQIEFLIDTWNGRISAQPFTTYSLFVTFFLHLIAGPITRHSEMMPQFERPNDSVAANLSIGLTIFAIGLGKKVFLADSIGIFTDPLFASAASGNALPLLPAWIAAVGFTLQLYFDFSGYSDMAIGVGRMFGIKLPLNFNSPFKARNIVDFWQRWHLTLTRYINAHLYGPIAASVARRLTSKPNSFSYLMCVMAAPTILVMTIAGIWHGAGLQYVVFGAMHGVLLAAYQTFRWGTRRWRRLETFRQSLPAWLCVAVTFGFVVISFVFFKAGSVDAALTILKGMAGLTWAPAAPEILAQLSPLKRIALLIGQEELRNIVIHLTYGYFELLVIPVGLAIAWFAPNMQEFLSAHLSYQAEPDGKAASPVVYKVPPAKGRFDLLWVWRPNVIMASLTAGLVISALMKANYQSAAFLYFQF